MCLIEGYRRAVQPIGQRVAGTAREEYNIARLEMHRIER